MEFSLQARLNHWFYTLARRFWPELEGMNDHRRLVAIGEIITFIYTVPLTVWGLFWLLDATDTTLIRFEWPALLFIFGLIVLFSLINYFIIIELRTDRYGSADGSLASMVHWSAVFLFGPTAIWLQVIWSIGFFLLNWFESTTKASRWNRARNLSMDLSVSTVSILVSLEIYQRLGGAFPIAGLSPQTIFPALAALLVHFILSMLIWSGYVLYHLNIHRLLSTQDAKPLLTFFLLSIGLPHLAHPFAILAAGLFVQNGLSVFLFFIVGLLLVSYLARQLSWVAESNRQQSRFLEKLEQLGRAIINAPPDASTLPEILQSHLPNMFPSGHISIRLKDSQALYHYPEDWPEVTLSIWDWCHQQTGLCSFLSKDPLPWDPAIRNHNAIIVSPIQGVEVDDTIGAIYLELRTLAQPWDANALANLFPAVQSLAAQVASALHQSEVYEKTLAFQNLTQELQLAGKIQSSFLPNQFPMITGWQIAVSLLPARDTSGDFFDIIPLEDGRLGLIIADVADKGVGPALYMALSRTLLRTYAEEYESDPEVVFYAANNRLLRDARANLFVTAFYGILDPSSGDFVYCNAGHNPPYLFSRESDQVKALNPTGMPMGIEENMTWYQEEITIQPGDVLVLYTDGIPDSQDTSGKFFDEEQLIECVKDNLQKTAYELQTNILENIQNFVGGAPQFDDITLMILMRDN